MDWNSPATKKHIDEAEAWGCTLMGAGASAMYRLYTLPCGHEQAVRIDAMRRGCFRCSLCLNEKMNQEAEAQGCELIGVGKSCLYRRYLLPCGHEQEASVSKMCEGGFRCSFCLNEKLNQEANAQGCKWIGPGKSIEFRLYALPCGHTQDVQPGNMRIGAFRCSICLDEKLSRDAMAQGCTLIGSGKSGQFRLYALSCGHAQEVRVANLRKGHFACKTCLAEKMRHEAAKQGCKLIGVGKSNQYRLYLLPCGHEQQVKTGHIRDGNFRCSVCMNEALHKEAKSQGYKLIGAGKNCLYRLYALPCGHEREVHTGAMRIGNVRCQVCLDNKLNLEARVQGCKLVGAGKNAHYRRYLLPCGHVQDVHCGRLREGYFRCQICEDTSRTQPSNVYLFHIKVDPDEWLKLGYAKVLDSRASRYGLPQAADVTTVYCLPCDTGNGAHALEASIHASYRRKRLTKKQMKDHHTMDGFSECYPVTMLETLLSELEAFNEQRAR